MASLQLPPQLATVPVREPPRKVPPERPPREAHTHPGPPAWVPLGTELPLSPGEKGPLVTLQCKFKQIEIAWIQMTYSNQLFITPPESRGMISPP